MSRDQENRYEYSTSSNWYIVPFVCCMVFCFAMMIKDFL